MDLQISGIHALTGGSTKVIGLAIAYELSRERKKQCSTAVALGAALRIQGGIVDTIC